LDGGQPTNTAASIKSYTAELDGFAARQKARLDAISLSSSDAPRHRPSSGVSNETRTHRSLFNSEKFKDTYTQEEREAILASLWVDPTSADLKRLESSELRPKFRELALRHGGDSIRDFRRFDVALFQALLHTQHEIILLEEVMSNGESLRDDVVRLTQHLAVLQFVSLSPRQSLLGSIYLTFVIASLIKSYKELSIMKRPGQKESRQIGRLLATALHEPRYWYAADALDLIDLRPEDVKESHDVFRTYLQRKAPVGFLDRIGHPVLGL
jgi:hypothetical protein